MSQVLISAENLRKQFGSVYAARDITIQIHEKSVCGLIGTNGAGKTTFVNMLTGYLKPDSGRILFSDEDITGLEPRVITNKGIARSFQIPQLFDTHTAIENVEIALGIAQKPLAEAPAILERFGLSEYADSVAGFLPEGVRKLLDIALSMVSEPRVLLLDEPTSGVDSGEKFNVMDRVMDVIRNAGITVLFVEHDMEIVTRYSDTVIAFFEGSILSSGEPETVMQNEKVRQYIIGEPINSAKQSETADA